MRIRTLWFTFFVMLMLLLPPLFAQMSPAGSPYPDDGDGSTTADLAPAADSR